VLAAPVYTPDPEHVHFDFEPEHDEPTTEQ
jgi:hypothetical protein